MLYRVAVVHGANPKQVHAQNRVHAGTNLFKAGAVEIVITTGKYEADDLAQIALKDGVPANAIKTEKESQTTYQNLRNLVLEIFPQLEDTTHHLELTYLISQRWHGNRLLYVAHHVLGTRYPHEFYPAIDGRSQEEIDADSSVERYKMWVDKATLKVPMLGGLINSSAYWALSRVRR